MKIGWRGGETGNPDGTAQLGEKLSDYMERGDVIALIGELASGKTTFIKGILKGLLYTKPVTSPTFTLINEYDAKYPVIHVDCYREEDLNRWIKVGLHDYMDDENIVIIEWADKMQSILPDDCIQIQITHMGHNQREITLKSS
tara:strand:- start:54 stop:482 length:429 start_codon:yes stop_codon:yes gene_type:complete